MSSKGVSWKGVFRAQRSMKPSGMVRCRPGILTRTAFVAVPDQRCTGSRPLPLHRIRDLPQARRHPL